MPHVNDLPHHISLEPPQTTCFLYLYISSCDAAPVWSDYHQLFHCTTDRDSNRQTPNSKSPTSLNSNPHFSQTASNSFYGGSIFIVFHPLYNFLHNKGYTVLVPTSYGPNNHSNSASSWTLINPHLLPFPHSEQTSVLTFPSFPPKKTNSKSGINYQYCLFREHYK